VPIEAKAKAWSPGKPLTNPPDLDLVFSDFPIRDGFETYFRLSNPKAANLDELYSLTNSSVQAWRPDPDHNETQGAK
jgi:hypothetical protein